MGREEKGEGGDRDNLVEIKESQMGREKSSQYSHSQVKMGSEDWVLKATKFDNKYKKAKIKNLE